MKIYFILTAVLSAFLLLFPLAGVGIANSRNQSSQAVSAVAVFGGEEADNTETESTIKVLRASSGNVTELSIRDYLIGVVSSEIPPEYEKEAIKAQTVACYTYAKWLMQNADNSNLDGADISDSSDVHQGYCDSDELKEKWGDKYKSYSEKIAECVDEVLGQYMTYNGEPIIACYHSLSPGATESAETVWGKDLPYLKSVTAPGDKLAADFDSTVTLSESEFAEKAKALGDITLGDDASKWVTDLKQSKVGFVTSVSIGSKTFDGNDVRTAFSLRSPYFTVEYSNGTFTFSVSGYGHGLGMSQYSADYMARQGSSYDEILKHFYSGIEIMSEN